MFSKRARELCCYVTISSSLGSRCVPWLGEDISMPSPNYPVLCCPLPYRVAPVFFRSLLSSFLVIWSPSGGTRGPSVVFEAVDMPCPGPFHFFHSVHYIYDLSFVLSLTQMLALLSLYVMLSILLSILVCAAASLFCACLVSVQVSAPYVIADSTQELYTCLFRQMARLLLKKSRCLAYAAQPAMILRCVSLSWFFSLRQ